MSDAPVYEIDLQDFWQDPYPDLKVMRADCPIARVPQLGATLFTKRDDIAVCEKNVEVFSSDQPGGLMNVLMGQNMMRKDGAAHMAERKIFFPAVSPKAVRQVWTSQFQAHAERLLDELVPEGAADLFSGYALPLSAEALKSMTGLTNMRFQDMDAWSQAMIDGIANYAGDPDIEARCHAATAGIDAAIDDMMPVVRETPNHSLLSVMLAGGMPMENIRANIKLTISGGQNEPRDAILGCIWALLTHPDQLALVREGKASWSQAFEEYCRWISPIGMSPRRIAQEHDYGGVRFDPEERIFFMFGSANRDEAHFETPEGFEVLRDNQMSMPFGAGPHFCAGAAASRSLVAGVALPMFFERLKDLEIDETDPVRIGGWAFRGLLNLPVTWRL
ncbi:cytochrome P450 [Pelagibius sp. Alg239-R121]|uniref:cytochrome P450 n=1 Tax=Pelagibius sp. Alg239-R121 TaxID=2993448 RepID=UPI0024A75CB0|nr:cytochrome P450 [Pelagibius sp. Alg239-R121]